MGDLALALGLGLATGILLLGLMGAARAPMVAWVAHAPLYAAVYTASPVVAGISALLAAGVALGFGYHGMFPFARALEEFLPLVGGNHVGCRVRGGGMAVAVGCPIGRAPHLAGGDGRP
jgi:hypothetical protein